LKPLEVVDTKLEMFLRRLIFYVQCVRSLLGSKHGAGSSSEEVTTMCMYKCMSRRIPELSSLTRFLLRERLSEIFIKTNKNRKAIEDRKRKTAGNKGGRKKDKKKTRRNESPSPSPKKEKKHTGPSFSFHSYLYVDWR
jgi:hypothetical protein